MADTPTGSTTTVQEMPSWLQDMWKSLLASGFGYTFGANTPTLTPEQIKAYQDMTKASQTNVRPGDWWGTQIGLDKAQVEAGASQVPQGAYDTYYKDPNSYGAYNPASQSYVFQNPGLVEGLHSDFQNTYNSPQVKPWAQNQFGPIPASNPAGPSIDPSQYARSIPGIGVGAIGGQPMWAGYPGGSTVPGSPGWIGYSAGFNPQNAPASASSPSSQGSSPGTGIGSVSNGGLGPGLPGAGIPAEKWGGSSTAPVWNSAQGVGDISNRSEKDASGIDVWLNPPSDSWMIDPEIKNSFTGESQGGNPTQWATQSGADFVKEQIKRLTGQDIDVTPGQTGGGPYSWAPSLEIQGANTPNKLNVGAIANLYRNQSKQQADLGLAAALGDIGIGGIDLSKQQYANPDTLHNTSLGAPTQHGEMTDAVKQAQQVLMSGNGDLAAANKTYYDWYSGKTPDKQPEQTPPANNTEPTRTVSAVPPSQGGANRVGIGPTGIRSAPSIGIGRTLETWQDPNGDGFTLGDDRRDAAGRQRFAEGGDIQSNVDTSTPGATTNTATTGATGGNMGTANTQGNVYGNLVGGYTPYPGQQQAAQGTLTNNYYAGLDRYTSGLLNPYSTIMSPQDVGNTGLSYLRDLFQNPSMSIANNIRGVYNDNVGNLYTPNYYNPSQLTGNDLTGGAQNLLMQFAGGGGNYQAIDPNQLLSLVGSYNGGGYSAPQINVANITAPTLENAARVQAPGMGDLAALVAPQMAGISTMSAPSAASAPTVAGQWDITAGPGATAQSWIDPGIAQAYMNPYQAAVMEQQKQLAQQRRDELQSQIAATAVKQGAYGGYRDAIQTGLADRELSRQMAQIDSDGLNQAWLTGQQQFNQDDARRVQAAIANQQAMLDASKSSAGYGLQAALSNQQANLAAQQMSGDWAVQAGRANMDAQNAAAQTNAQLAAQVGIASQGNQADLMKAKAQMELQAALGNQQADMSTAQANAQIQSAVAQANQRAQSDAAIAQANAAAQMGVAAQNAAVQMAQLRGNLGLQSMLANQQGYNQSQDRALQALTSGGNMALQAGLGAANLNEQSRQFGAGLTDAGFQRMQAFDLDTARFNADQQNSIVSSNLNAAGLQGQTAMNMLNGSSIYGNNILQQLAALQQGGAQNDYYNQQTLNGLYNQFLQQQAYPNNQLSWLASLMQGTPTPYTQTAYQYQNTNPLNGILGAITSGIGALSGGGK